MEVQTLREHTDQVLHLSFSHSGYQFASCSKDCTVKVRARGRASGPGGGRAGWRGRLSQLPTRPQIWSNDLTISLLHSADMRPYNWSYTQFSQFNQDDSLLLASGVFLGPHNSSSGEIAVISLGESMGLLHPSTPLLARPPPRTCPAPHVCPTPHILPIP